MKTYIVRVHYMNFKDDIEVQAASAGEAMMTAAIALNSEEFKAKDIRGIWVREKKEPTNER